MGIGDLKKNEIKSSLEGFSNVYEARLGGFGGQRFQSSIKTYFTNANVKRLDRDIKTYETLSENKDWPVSNLMQREVDYSRVEQISQEYLLPEKTIKYFPPIIIAFIPIDDIGAISPKKTLVSDQDLVSAKNYAITKIKEGLTGNTDEIESLILTSENISKIDGLYVLDVIGVVGYYLIFWDLEKIHAVIIDGQHRFEALKRTAIKNPMFEDFRQDLLFIEISEKIFKEDSPQLIEMIRKIFIDINTNPVEVNEAKNILMTDNDISSVLVQCIVDDSKIKENNSFIRPELIDWHSLNLKHELPFLTNILLLKNILYKNFLKGFELGNIKKNSSKNYIYKVIYQLNHLFRIDELIETNEAYKNYIPLKTSLENYKKNIISTDYLDDADSQDDFNIFNYDYRIIQIIKNEFNSNYSQAIVYLFNELKPFRLIINELELKNFLKKESDERKAIIKSKETKSKNLIKDTSNNLKSEFFPLYYIFYTVLGQKAVFKIFFEYLSAKILEEKMYEPDIIKDYARNFVKEWNLVFNILKYSPKKITLFGAKFINENKIDSNIQKVPDSILKNCTSFDLKDFQPQATKLWEDIIYYNDKIIYKEKGINNLVFVLRYIFDSISKNKDNPEVFESVERKKYQSEYSSIEEDISMRISKAFDKSEKESSNIAKSILEAKFDYIDLFLKEAIAEYNSQTTP